MWLARHTEEKTMPILEKVVKTMKEAYPEGAANGVYTIGYCFGGKYVLKLAATDDIKAGAFAHGTQGFDCYRMLKVKTYWVLAQAHW